MPNDVINALNVRASRDRTLIENKNILKFTMGDMPLDDSDEDQGVGDADDDVVSDLANFGNTVVPPRVSLEDEDNSISDSSNTGHFDDNNESLIDIIPIPENVNQRVVMMMSSC
jgi:hypothetical protein